MNYKLYKHQIDFLIKNPNKTTLVWSCGTGKTRAAIEWAKDRGRVMIICPKALQTNWRREGQKWDVKLDIYSKETFRRDYQKIPRYTQVIVDEVHNGFLTPNFKSQMSKALCSYLKVHNVPRVLLLSATVYTSSPWNIYNLAFFTGHKWDYIKFKYTFFYDIQIGFRTVSMAKSGIENKLAQLTQKIANVVNIYDVMDVPLQNHTDPEYFSLSKQQIKAIEDHYDPVPIVRYTAQHEIEQGILLGNEFRKEQTFQCSKNERILQLVEENKKIAIVCRYNMQISLLLNLIQSTGKKVYVINGGVKDRDTVTLEAEKSADCAVLIQADCAEGYQLPSFEVCVFASMSYSYVKWEQICGRFLRMDKPSRTTFIYLLTEGVSIDQAVFNSIQKKLDFKIELYEKRS